MYNLLITSQSGAWKKNVYEYERGRAVREYTDKPIQEIFKAFTKENINELMSLPCVFAYEGGVGASARLGWLTSIKARDALVRIEYEIDKSLPPISAAKIEKLKTELDITDWELNRTHWAVKDVNLVHVLKSARVLTDAKLKALGSSHRFVRLGTTRPLAELRIHPDIFRIPTGKVEEDLVSIMMPFETSFDRTFETVKAACKACSLRCERADDIWDEHEIIQDVFSLIYRSRLVICDLTGRNPNVFYETGIAHTLGKTVIPIAQSKGDVPFDLGHLRYVKYLANNEGRAELEAALVKRITKIVSG